MKKIILKPHIFFFSLIPVVIILGYLLKNNSVNIALYNETFSIALNHISLYFAVFFGLIGLNYFSLHFGNKTPYKWMTIIHLSMQIIALLLFFSKDYWNVLGENNFSFGLNINMDYATLILFISFILFVFGTMIHLINFFASLINKSK